MGYCQARGIPFGAVSNGHQFIAFISNRQDGIPPEEGLAIVFDSLDSIRAGFKEFWNLFSPLGLESGQINLSLSDTTPTPPPEKLSSRLVDYPGYKNRNPVAAELQILGGLFLEDITKQPDIEEEFVRETYCESGALSQYALISKEMLNSRYTSYFQKETKVTVKPVRTKKGIQPDFRNDLLAANISRRPIILVGDVGVGKSMFIRRLILVDAKDVLDKAIVLYLNFGNRPALVTEISSYVMLELEQQLKDEYSIDIQERNFVRGVYHSELQRFAQGIYSDLAESSPEVFRKKEIDHLHKLMLNQEQHLRACLFHIVTGQKKQIVIFLDNVDQRPLEFQEQVFLIAQAFAENWPVTSFVALRPDTFAHSRASGSLSAYQPRVFTIDPPRIDRVIQKRLWYALKKLRETGTLSSLPKGVSLDSQKLVNYFEMLQTAFEKSEDIIRCVDNMSNGNLRRALDFIIAFVGSAHVDSEKIFGIIEESGSYTLPIHEFLRAIIFGDNDYYDPSDSPVVNVFDVISNDRREHFLLLSLLSYIEKIGMIGGNEGFVPVEQIYKTMQNYGFSERQILFGIQRALKKELLASPKIQHEKPISRLRVLPAGAYTTKILASMFSYIDAIVTDTPIITESYRAHIQPVEVIGERLNRAMIFKDYLSSCWDPSLSTLYDWPSQTHALINEIKMIKARIERRDPNKEIL